MGRQGSTPARHHGICDNGRGSKPRAEDLWAPAARSERPGVLPQAPKYGNARIPPGDERAGGTALEDREGVGECWGRLLAEERPSRAQGPCAGGRRCPCPQLRAVSRLQLSARGRGAQRTRPARHPTAPWGRGTLQNWPDHGTVQGTESKRPPQHRKSFASLVAEWQSWGWTRPLPPARGCQGSQQQLFGQVCDSSRNGANTARKT